jgi:hypothetical protein
VKSPEGRQCLFDLNAFLTPAHTHAEPNEFRQRRFQKVTAEASGESSGARMIPE